jgi:hypothetical protein
MKVTTVPQVNYRLKNTQLRESHTIQQHTNTFNNQQYAQSHPLTPAACLTLYLSGY